LNRTGLVDPDELVDAAADVPLVPFVPEPDEVAVPDELVELVLPEVELPFEPDAPAPLDVFEAATVGLKFWFEVPNPRLAANWPPIETEALLLSALIVKSPLLLR